MLFLGGQCGLMPGGQISSEQLNMVVDLIAGLNPAEGKLLSVCVLQQCVINFYDVQYHLYIVCKLLYNIIERRLI